MVDALLQRGKLLAQSVAFSHQRLGIRKLIGSVKPFWLE
jgi:hypothetical protein